MPNVTLAKPKGVAAAFLASGAAAYAIGAGDDATNHKLVIKVHDFQMDGRAGDVTETTGDNDTWPVFEHSEHLYVDFTLTGWAVAAKAVGFKNMVDPAINPGTSTEMELKVFYGSAQAQRFKVLVHRIRLNVRRNAAACGLAMVGVMTNQDPTAATFDQATGA